MKEAPLTDLQARVRDVSAFGSLADYYGLCRDFLSLARRTPFTRIVSPSQQSYIFYQYDDAHGYRITRPLNANLFIESPDDFSTAFERFIEFLGDLKKYQGQILR